MPRSHSFPESILVAVLILAGCASASSPTPSPTLDGPPGTSAPTATPGVAPTDSVASRSGVIAAGYEHTCGVTPAGGVRCWGGNGSGQLGSAIQSGTGSADPVEVGGLGDDVRAIAAGAFHTCALNAGGGVKCWGYNLYGQLGNGSNADSNSPVDVVGLGSGVVAISAGWSHTCAVTRGGAAKCWGNNPFGGLGNGTTTDSNVPVDVSGLASGVVAIAAGSGHTCAVTNGGGVTCWGDGQADDPAVFHTSVPNAVPELASGVRAITAGLDGTCALVADGDVTCWGPNYGASEDGVPAPERFTAIDLSGFPNVAAIASGESHTCALAAGGRIACWGGNRYGQLGQFRVPFSETPVAVAGLEDVTAIAAGGLHTCAMGDDGGVRCWGANRAGQLGPGVACVSSSIPAEIPLDGGAGLAPPTAVPTVPTGQIEHALGATDVVLRLDLGPDQSVGELEGEVFQPGPEFTLYGDGTVIVRDAAAEPSVEGPIVRGAPFLVARLGEDRVQAVLRDALGDGGLVGACDLYENTFDTDAFGGATLTIEAGDVARRVEVSGPSPLEALIARLREFDMGASGQRYEPDAYWGSLFDAQAAIDAGVIPDPGAAGGSSWPWPAITPQDFAPRASGGGWAGYPRRALSTDEAAVLGLSRDGGVVQRIYLVGPDGTTVYVFSLWPMLPDEAG